MAINTVGKRFSFWTCLLATITIFLFCGNAYALTVGEWANEWENTKKEFKKVTGKKKPTKSIMGIRKKVGLSETLRDLDEMHKDVKSNDQEDYENKLEAFKKLVEKFSGDKDKYIDYMEPILEKEEKKAKNPAYAKWLKVLKKDLSAIEASLNAEYERLHVSYEQKISLTNDSPQVIVEKTKMIVIKTLPSEMNSALKRFSLDIKKCAGQSNLDALEKSRKALHEDIRTIRGLFTTCGDMEDDIQAIYDDFSEPDGNILNTGQQLETKFNDGNLITNEIDNVAKMHINNLAMQLTNKKKNKSAKLTKKEKKALAKEYTKKVNELAGVLVQDVAAWYQDVKGYSNNHMAKLQKAIKNM